MPRVFRPAPARDHRRASGRPGAHLEPGGRAGRPRMPVRVYGSANQRTRSADPLTCVACAVLKVNDRGTDDGGRIPGRRPFPKVRWLATDSPAPDGPESSPAARLGQVYGMKAEDDGTIKRVSGLRRNQRPRESTHLVLLLRPRRTSALAAPLPLLGARLRSRCPRLRVLAPDAARRLLGAALVDHRNADPPFVTYMPRTYIHRTPR